MRQTKLESAIEAICNIGSGFLLAMLIWQFVAAPLWGYEVTLLDNFGLTILFTSVSVVRSYVWRRFFEHRIRARIHKYHVYTGEAT